MKTLPRSQNFTDLIDRNAVYVDKTEVIFELIKKERVFFSRPRRFGKSLTLTTIATLFEHGVDRYFKDTWIFDKWHETTYPVLQLNCLDFLVSDYDRFVKSFCNEIRDFAREQKLDNFAPDELLPGVYMQALFKALPKKQKIVILVDEYDCGLTRNINNKTEYDKYVECLRGFYAVLKGNPHIRFLAITGVTRLKNIAIFSVGSDIKDVTYAHKLATLTGYTRSEIIRYFREYILDVVSNLSGIHLMPDEISDDNPYVRNFLDRLALEYDGYCFDELYMRKVYSTWSVNNFFENNFANEIVHFGDYWFDNGGVPSILKNYLDTHELDMEAYAQQELISSGVEAFKNPISLLDISPSVLMCQTGYLTLRSVLSFGKPLLLGIPNNEVRKALAGQLYFKCTSRELTFSDEQSAILEHGSSAEILKLFNALFSSASYEHYSVRDEATLRYPLQCFFMGAGILVTAEKENCKGRADLELEFPKRRIVIELKYVHDSKDASRAIKTAITQIKERDYGNTLPLKKELLRLALVFDGSKDVRRFIQVEEC